MYIMHTMYIMHGIMQGIMHVPTDARQYAMYIHLLVLVVPEETVAVAISLYLSSVR